MYMNWYVNSSFARTLVVCKIRIHSCIIDRTRECYPIFDVHIMHKSSAHIVLYVICIYIPVVCAVFIIHIRYVQYTIRYTSVYVTCAIDADQIYILSNIQHTYICIYIYDILTHILSYVIHIKGIYSTYNVYNINETIS